MKRNKLLSALLILMASLCFVGCASTGAQTTELIEAVSAPLVAEYSLVGYDFGFKAENKTVEFTFMDVASDKELPLFAQALMSVLPGAESYEYAEGGTFTFAVKKALNEEQFNSFVSGAQNIIYNAIY